MRFLHGSIEGVSIVHMQHPNHLVGNAAVIATSNAAALPRDPTRGPMPPEIERRTMAYMTQGALRAQGGLLSRLAEARTALGERLARRAVYRRTLNEMSMLSDRDLADLGVHRSQLRSIAWKAAHDA